MFCGKCGAKNADDASFCTGCGASLKEVRSGGGVAISSESAKYRRVGIIAVSAVAVILIAVIVIVCVSLFGGRSFEATIDKYFSAAEKGDVASALELYPQKALNALLREKGYEKDTFIQEKTEEQELLTLFGLEYSLSYQIQSTSDVLGDNLAELKNTYKEWDVKISAARKAEVTLTWKFGTYENESNATLTLVKVGKSWYMDISTADLF